MDGIVLPMIMDSIVDQSDSHDALVKRPLKIMNPMDASMQMHAVELALRRPWLLDLINLVYVFVDVALAHQLLNTVFHNSHRKPPNCTCMADQLVRMDYLVIDRTWLPLPYRIFAVHIVYIQLDTGCPKAFVDCAVKIGTQCSMDLCKLV